MRDINLFLPNGYLDVDSYLDFGAYITIIIGGRGCGKTYGILKRGILKQQQLLFLRRTAEVCDVLKKEQFSPYIRLNKDLNKEIYYERITKKIGVFKDGDRDLAILSPLSTYYQARGIGGDNLSALYYDEFIREKNERALKNEDDALFNGSETTGRNRELEGDSPFKMILSGNSNFLDSPILASLDQIRRVAKLKKALKSGWSYDKDRDILVVYITDDCPILARKANTALYKATKGTKFYSMAIESQFAEDALKERTIKFNPKQYKPVWSISGLTLYEHKSDDYYYLSTHRQGGCPTYKADGTDLKKFRRRNGKYFDAYIENKIFFEDESTELLFRHIYLDKSLI